MEFRSQTPEAPRTSETTPITPSPLPEFKRVSMLVLLQRIKGVHEASDWNDMVERLKVLEARHPEILMDLDMRTTAWEIIEGLLKAKPEDSEEKMEERAKKITFLETKFPRVPADPKRAGKRRSANNRTHPDLAA